MDKLLLTPEEAFDLIGVSRSYGFQLLAERSIPSIKVGRLRRIPVAGLKAWIDDKHADTLNEPND